MPADNHWSGRITITPPLTWPFAVAPPRSSSGAYGAALFAADLVPLPWWARLAPRSAQDRVRVAFARSIADAVEQHVTSNHTTTEGN